MANFNFADDYKLAGLAPSPEIIKLRQAPFEKLRKSLDNEKVLGLTRLYFGLLSAQSYDWLIQEFHEADPSFSALDNNRELAVLSSCLLSAALVDGNLGAALAIISTSVGGRRQSVYEGNITSKALRSLQSIAMAQDTTLVDSKKILRPVRSKIGESADALVAEPDVGKVASLVKQLDDHSNTIVKSLADQVATVVTPLVRRVGELEDELAVLWWHVGGWSKTFDEPMQNLSLPVVSLIAGYDLGNLPIDPPGPLATPALLYRAIFAGRKEKDKSTSVCLREAIDGLTVEQLSKVSIPEKVGMNLDVFPIHGALMRGKELGRSAAWEEVYNRSSSFDLDSKFKPAQLAIQTFYESMLLLELN